VKVKAVFDNKEMKLWPGAYANIDLSVLTLKDVIVVPRDALVIGVNAVTVFIADKDGKAAQKPVKVQYSYGNDAIVTGLEEGMKVVLEGKQNLRPGVPIKDRADAIGGNGASGDADKSDKSEAKKSASNPPASAGATAPSPASAAASAASAS
jgi:hypothetical protein